MKDRLFSGCVYFSLFAVVLLFAFLVDKLRGSEQTAAKEAICQRIGLDFCIQKRSYPFVLCMLCSIPVVLLPCLLAGIRAKTVGVDVTVYAESAFRQMAGAQSLAAAMRIGKNFEPGYRILTYVARRLSPKLGSLLFLTELLTILPIYIVAWRRAPRIPVTSSMFVYLLFFYCATFNIMRQSIAAAFLLLAFQLLEEHKYISSLVSTYIAVAFHNSTFIGIAIYIAVLVLARNRNFNQLLSYLPLILGGCIAVYLTCTVALKILISRNMVPERYQVYVNVFSGKRMGKDFYFNLILDDYYAFFCRLLVALLLILFGRQMVKKNADAAKYWLSYVISFSIYAVFILLMHTTYGMRIVWMVEFSLVLVLPELMASAKKKSLKYVSAVLVSLLYFSGFVVFGWHGILPLQFSI